MRIMTNHLALFFALLLYALADSLPASDTTILAPEPTHINSIILTDPRPARLGFTPHFGQQTPWLRKRECLGNGTNFCFGDRSRFCPDCGGCCEARGESWCCPDEGATCCPGERCCGADERCCGRGCCPKGRRCSRGRCEVPVVTVTSTKTAHATETHSEVEIVTVKVNVHVTTTVNSIITTTITSEQGTHTEVTYETTTLIAKRSLSTPALDHYVRLELDTEDEPSGILARAFSRLWRRLIFGGHLQRPEYEDLLASSEILPSERPEVRRRQNDADDEDEEDEESDGTSTVTHTKTTTAVDETTVTDSTTTTDFVTSTITKTIFQTSTRIIGARATISITSTITLTSHPPTTNTITSTSTSYLDPTPSPTAVSISPPPPSSNNNLSTPAITGISIGTALAALTLALLALIFLRRRRKRRARALEPDYLIAPQPSPVPSPGGDVYFEKVAGHSRGASAGTTRVSSGDGALEWWGGAGVGGRGSVGGRESLGGMWPDAGEADAGERPVRRSIPHPSSSTVGRMARFAGREGSGPGGVD